jgi:hypothetical protein
MLRNRADHYCDQLFQQEKPERAPRKRANHQAETDEQDHALDAAEGLKH